MNRIDGTRARMVLVWWLIAAAAAAAHAVPPVVAAPSALSNDAAWLLRWVHDRADNRGQSFIVIDKREARLWVFDSERRLVDTTPVLLGLAHGDRSVPGIGERPLGAIRPEERTTPAGRFSVEPGRNLSGEDIYWIDYDAAVSLHRVRASNPRERRLQRLASASPVDNRISFGCINVPADFYQHRIEPRFVDGRGTIYILPEHEPLTEFFRP